MGEIVVSENMKQYERGKASVMAMKSSGKAINMMSLRVYVSWRDGKMFELCYTGVLFLCIQNKFVEFPNRAPRNVHDRCRRQIFSY
jgi:hypothetical protein